MLLWLTQGSTIVWHERLFSAVPKKQQQDEHHFNKLSS
jgi:hypothetical protein